MLSRKGQCKWTCRLMPFRIGFILLHHLVISVNNSSFIWAKTSFPCIAQVPYFSVLGCLIYTRKKGIVCHRGVVAAPGDMPCLVCFVNQLFINLGIPSDHASFLHKQCNSFDANSDGIYSWHHHALSNKNILKSWQLSNVHISWFVYHLVSLAKFTHTTEANILLG